VLKVCELFTSVQGEGEVIGIPSHFVRLYGCNLKCVWCDTKYSWIRQDRAQEGVDYYLMSEDEIAKKLAFGTPEIVPLVTITGGEPLLQNIERLVALIKEYRHKIVVETNGTIKPCDELLKQVDIWSVSPKLRNCGEIVETNLSWLKFAKYYYVKFVIINPWYDLEEVYEVCSKWGIPKERVFVQPDGNRPDYSKALAELAEANLKGNWGFRVCLQLHRVAWGHKRGV
jgi:7-carboxy-7-deazaguanine synthase